MIFISHYSGDKPFVARYAEALEAEFGRDEVFYDSWSITPGDDIVGGIDKALERCTHFLLFMTEASLQREWVKAEWHAAFVRKMTAATTLIPVRLDDCQPPPLLASLKGVDATDSGPGPAIGELVAVIRGESSYVSPPEAPNITAMVWQDEKSLLVALRVGAYIWHNPEVTLMFDCTVPEAEAINIPARIRTPTEGIRQHGVGTWVLTGDPTLRHRLAVFIGLMRPVSVASPIEFELDDPPGRLVRVMKTRPEPEQILYNEIR